MIKKLSFLTFCFSLLFIQSCATIFNGGSQSIIANGSGDVEDVSIYVKTPSGSYKSKLPTTIVTTPSSFNNTTVTAKDKCYEETEMVVGKSVTPSFWANFLLGLGFPIGMAIDFLDGTMWKMDQQVLIPLNKRDVCKK
ncbi:MAG: hypothetical protein K0R25_831 [Rickettsiaceae bacterium]|jgi:hypothetical protein|nr:hypothetical protein [Rickettsiaceae bacterium]